MQCKHFASRAFSTAGQIFLVAHLSICTVFITHLNCCLWIPLHYAAVHWEYLACYNKLSLQNLHFHFFSPGFAYKALSYFSARQSLLLLHSLPIGHGQMDKYANIAHTAGQIGKYMFLQIVVCLLLPVERLQLV